MKKILAIEDNPIMIKILESRFRQEPDVEFLIAIDPDEGLRKVEKDKPDLVLLDMMLPGKSGLTILERIKKNPKTKNIPVAVFTTVSRQATINEMMERGAADYIVKGAISLEEAVERIRNLLNSSRLTEDSSVKKR